MSTLGTWDQITGAIGSTTSAFGGEWGNYISKLLTGEDIGLIDPTKKPNINTEFRFRSEKLRLNDTDDSHQLTFVVDDIDTGPIRKVHIRRMNNPNEQDYMVLESQPQTLSSKTLSSPNISTIINSGGTITLPTTTTTVIGTNTTNTLTNKTISRTNNSLSYIGTYAFSIYREGGAVKVVTNATGAVASYATLGPAIDAVLANTSDPTAEVHDGFYDLASGFTGWNVITLTNIWIHENAYINVPEGYTGDVWKLSPTDTVVYKVVIDGGRYDEQGASPSYLWDCIAIEPISTNPPTTTGAVYDCNFQNMFIWRCNRPIYLHTTNKSWINENRFVNIYTEGGKIIGAEFEHTGTWTAGQSGINGNYFENVNGQSTALDTTNHFPATTYGFKNVIGEFNTFVHCVPWDLSVSGSAVSTMTIGANATATKIIGGIVDSVNFTDNGVRTSVNGWNGILHNDVATFGGTTTFLSPPTIQNNTEELFTLYRPTTSTFAYGVLRFDQLNAASTRKTFGRIISTADDRTNGAEYTWFGFEYMQNGVLDMRGMFYNDGVYFGRPSQSQRVGITNAGISGGNKTFTFPNLSGEITTNNGTQTLINKTMLNSSNFFSGIAQNSLTKRWGGIQPGYGTAVGTVGVLDGLGQQFTPTGAGSNTVSFDTTEGKVTNYQTSSASGVIAGLVSNTAGGGLGRRLFGGRMICRFKLDSTTSARFYFGLTSATSLPISDTPLASGDHGIIVGFSSADTNYQVRHNDGATVTTTQLNPGGGGAVAKTNATAFHTIEISWTASGNYTITYDGSTHVISTDLPATTADLYPNLMVQTSAVVQRTFTLKGLWIETDK